MLSKSCGVVVNNNHTDIVVNIHSNRIFIVISQYEKLGSIVTVSRDAAVQGFNNTTVYDTKVIFGKDEPEILSATRHVAEQLNADKPLLISICLKDYEVTTVRQIAQVVKKIIH